MKITDTIKPFTTPFRAPDVVDLRDQVAHAIKIKSGVATIYEDGEGNSITVPIWGYNGQFLGPTLLMNRNQQIDMTWINAVKGNETLPCVAVEVAGETAQNDLGIEADAEPTMGHECLPRFTTHLHGGKIPPASDGWPESMMLPGQNALKRYENNQRASLIWYHDHAMHTTRLNVYAGMAGAWMITDAEEAALQLPGGDKMLPLVIQDRNLSVSHDGMTRLCCCKKKCSCTCNQLGSGDELAASLFNSDKVRLLHKVGGRGGASDAGPMEFFGPLNLVNGAIWPIKAVEPTCYRLRMLNGANSRTYGLVFAELDGNGDFHLLSTDKVNAAVRQIGTDGGLLKEAVLLPADKLEVTEVIKVQCETGNKNEKVNKTTTYPVLILSPAERTDVLIDFSYFEGRKIVLLNCAASPFANEFINPLERLDNGDYSNVGDLLAYPQVMQFTVAAGKTPSYSFDALNKRFEDLAALTCKEETSYETDRKLIDAKGKGCDHIKTRTIAIVEKTEGNKPMLVLWELLKGDELTKGENDPVLRSTKSITVDKQIYYVAAEHFQDPVSYMVEYGSTECWRFINLTADTHPMHLHLVQFMAQERALLDTLQVKAKSDEIQRILKDLSLPPTSTLKTSLENNTPIKLNADGGLILALVSNLKISEYTINIEKRADSKDKGLDANEQGFKDTIRVNPGEMVSLKAYFDGYMGRYVYHCHLLEHEDHDMMRQFVVTRNDLHGSMQEGGMIPVSVGKKGE